MMQLRSSPACRRLSPSLSPPTRSSAIPSACSLSSSVACRRRISCLPFLHCLSEPSNIQLLLPLARCRVFARSSRALASADTRNLDEEQAKRSQVSKRLETVGRYFRRLGTISFWGQLVCTVVSAVILAFSVIISGSSISGSPAAQATFYLTAGGITAAFLSVFWAFGYVRLSERLRGTVHELSKAPPRADVVNQLKNGVIINLLGMGLTLLGMEATVGALVAKSLTSTAGPILQGIPAGFSPVLALDVFLVQASANTVVSHFLGLASSLELLRAVNKSPPPESVLKPA
eukprot:c34474_g1_i1 orf=70-936(+)